MFIRKKRADMNCMSPGLSGRAIHGINRKSLQAWQKETVIKPPPCKKQTGAWVKSPNGSGCAPGESLRLWKIEQGTSHLPELSDLLFQQGDGDAELFRIAGNAVKGIRRPIDQFSVKSHLILGQQPAAAGAAFFSVIHKPVLPPGFCTRQRLCCSGIRLCESPGPLP